MNKKNFKTLIIMCWVLLAVCVIIKLFGGNWFELSTDNTKFIEFCNYVDNTMWLKMTIYCIIAIFTTYPLICIFLKKRLLSVKECFIFIPIMIIKSILGWYFSGITYLFDIVLLILLPLILKRFKNWKRILVGNVLIFAFQLIAMFIRSLCIDFATLSNTLDTLLVQIDYFIMIMLYYFYDNYFLLKKEG